MRSLSFVAAFSLWPAALASILHQLPVNTEGETSVRPLDITDLNADIPTSYPDLSSDCEQRGFDEGPPENTTGNLVFDTVHSFLQHWPNTRYRNGHNIVPGVIPTGTLLYHGTYLDSIPTKPDWVATDPEHSIVFCRGMDGGCWHLTLAATRPLKVLYFDGSSAAKVPEGTMDIQDIITWGEPKPDRFFDERNRIIELCRWGKEFGIDGFARMEMDFEVMLCDFTAGVKVVSFLNLVTLGPEKVPRYSAPHFPPPGSELWIRQFEVMHAGSWHNHYPGDSRIVLDLTGLISLYDTSLAPSLIPVRADLERCDHRVLGISSEDISQVMRRLTEIVSRPDPVGSGIDWKTLVHVIVDRYADRLELLQYLLNFTSSDSQELLQRATLAQAQLRVTLTPYLLYSLVVPNKTASGVNALQWAHPIFTQCATTHTSELKAHIQSMTSSERLLLRAIEETTREICRVTTKMWANGVMGGLDSLFEVEPDTEPEIIQIFDGWRDETQKLMSWLDWSVWIKCRPACGPEEMCYLPTWPINAPPIEHKPPRNPRYLIDAPQPMCPAITPPPEDLAIANMFYSHWTPKEDWRKPLPKCIRRVMPYEF